MGSSDDVKDYFPSTSTEQKHCLPIYEELPGWDTSTCGTQFIELQRTLLSIFVALKN